MISVGDIISAVGVFSTPGDIMSTLGGVKYTGGYHVYTMGDTKMHVGSYHEYTGGCSVHPRDTMSTPGGVQYTGGIP